MRKEQQNQMPLMITSIEHPRAKELKRISKILDRYLNSRFEEDPLDDTRRHVRPWRAAFEHFIDRYNLL